MDPWFDAIATAVQTVIGRISERLPAILGAAALLLVGWLLARVVRAVLLRLLTRALERLGQRRLLAADDRLGLRRSLPPIAAGVAFWGILVVFGVAAVDTLGLSVLGELLGSLARYLPQVLAAVLIAFVGFAVASLVHDVVASATEAAALPYGRTLARAAQAAVLVLALVMAADQAGLDSTFLMISLPVALAALLGGAALAFGLGSRTAVSNIIAAYHLLELYEVGQRVRIAGFEGRIVEVTSTAVILDTPDGRVVVPAKLFSEQISVMVEGGQP